jgi:hypothetical protein
LVRQCPRLLYDEGHLVSKVGFAKNCPNKIESDTVKGGLEYGMASHLGLGNCDTHYIIGAATGLGSSGEWCVSGSA